MKAMGTFCKGDLSEVRWVGDDWARLRQGPLIVHRVRITR